VEGRACAGAGSTMKETLEAGVLYFALVFAVGFLLGTVRTLWAVPRLGVRTAELMEQPIMRQGSFADWLGGMPYWVSALAQAADWRITYAPWSSLWFRFQWACRVCAAPDNGLRIRLVLSVPLAYTPAGRPLRTPQGEPTCSQRDSQR